MHVMHGRMPLKFLAVLFLHTFAAAAGADAATDAMVVSSLMKTLDKPLPNPASFDFSRCPDGQPLKVYVYPQDECVEETPDNEQFNRIIRAMRKLPTTTTNPEEACILVPAFDSSLILSPSQKCRNQRLQDLPYWDQGQNHLLFFFGDEPRLPMFADVENALVAAASVDGLSGNWRQGHDISSGLFESSKVQKLSREEKRYFQESGNSMMKRPLLLSFAGRVNAGTSRDAYVQQLLKLSMGPQEAQDQLAKYTPLTPKVNDIKDGGMFFRVHNSADEGAPSYMDLMKGSVFTFCPEGDNKATNRVTDALSFGSIPVIVSKGYELPFEGLHEGEKAWAIHLPEANLTNISGVSAMLRGISDDEVMAMRSAGAKLFDRTWSSPESWVSSLVDVVQRRVHNHHAQLAKSTTGISMRASSSQNVAEPDIFTVDLDSQPSTDHPEARATSPKTLTQIG